MPQNTQGITDTDMRTAARIFNRDGFPLPQRFFHYAPATDTFTLHRIQPDGTDTLVATMNPVTGEWDDVGD